MEDNKKPKNTKELLDLIKTNEVANKIAQSVLKKAGDLSQKWIESVEKSPIVVSTKTLVKKVKQKTKKTKSTVKASATKIKKSVVKTAKKTVNKTAKKTATKKKNKRG